MNFKNKKVKEWFEENKEMLKKWVEIEEELKEANNKDIEAFLNKREAWYKENWKDNFEDGSKFNLDTFLYNLTYDAENVL